MRKLSPPRPLKLYCFRLVFILLVSMTSVCVKGFWKNIEQTRCALILNNYQDIKERKTNNSSTNN